MDNAQALLSQLLEAYNRNDLEAMAALMTPDVDWPNQLEGGRVIGRSAFEAYWRRTRRLIHAELAACAFAVQSDGRIAVDINQTMHNVETGRLWSDSLVRHYYTLRDGRVARMDTEPLKPGT